MSSAFTTRYFKADPLQTKKIAVSWRVILCLFLIIFYNASFMFNEFCIFVSSDVTQSQPSLINGWRHLTLSLNASCSLANRWPVCSKFHQLLDEIDSTNLICTWRTSGAGEYCGWAKTKWFVYGRRSTDKFWKCVVLYLVYRISRINLHSLRLSTEICVKAKSKRSLLSYTLLVLVSDP